MPFETRLVEHVQWLPVHGATVRVSDDGLLTLGDGNALDWHLLRWADPRLDGARVKLSFEAKAADSCDTNLYVHHWGDRDVCGIDRDGLTIFNDSSATITVGHLNDGFVSVTVEFDNSHPTLSFGAGKPRGRYQGTGTDQFLFRRIDVEILPRNRTRQTIIDRVWRGNDPFRGLPDNLFQYDLHGWNSQHPYLSDSISALRPELIVEVGVWKGGSTVFMANELKTHAISSVVIAIDTWLGSSEHWMGPFREDLSLLSGHPALYFKFLSNVLNAKVADYVVPLPLDSLNAAEVLGSLNLRPEMIHLDGGHDYESVTADLRVWWPLLAPGGLLIGDDYYTDGMWDTVRKAFDEFFGVLDLMPLENVAGKCRVQKPG